MNFLKKRPKLVVVFVLFLIIIVSFVTCYQLILVPFGNLLLKEDAPEDASYIVVLQGGIPDRIVYGVELYREGYADNILMVESKSFSNYELIDQYKLKLPSSVDINKEAALQMGVEEEDIIILPGKVDSTRQEAGLVGDYLEEQVLDQGSDQAGETEQAGENKNTDKKILIVTSRFHSNRARMIFEDEFSAGGLEGQVEVVSTPSPYDPFEPEEWWKDRRQARNVFIEYIKLINFYTFDM